MTKEELFTKYPYIVAWGKWIGSSEYYIEGQCKTANNEGANENSVYWNSELNKWIQFDELTKVVKKQIEGMLIKI